MEFMMKNLNYLVVSLLAIIATSNSVFAEDLKSFYVRSADEVVMEFDVVSEAERTVELTGYFFPKKNKYSGEVELPTEVTHKDITYKIIGIKSTCGKNTSVFYGNLMYEDVIRNKTKILNIPEGIQYIGNSAFSYCKASEVNLPSSLQIIGNSAFSNCEFTKIKLPFGLQKIGDDAFYDCILSEVNLPPTLIEIGRNAFFMPIRVHYEVPPMSGGAPTEINEYRDFEGSLIISNFVEKISDRAFDYDNFKNVTLGQNVKIIESNAFGTINNLICCATTPPTKKKMSIYNDNINLFVPPGCKEIYKQDENWSRVASIEEYEYYVNVEFDNMDILSHKILKGRLFKGQTRTLHPKITWLHEGSSERFRYWYSSDENVATVDQNGVITAKNFGEATITLMIEDERGVPFNCNYDVLVTTSADVDIIESDDADTAVEVFTLNGLKVGDTTDNLPAGFYIVKSAKEVKKIFIK